MNLFSNRFSILSKDERVVEDSSLIYQNLESYKGGTQNFTELEDITVQKSRADHFHKILKSHDLEFKDKTVLDVSGGSGVFVKQLQSYGALETWNTEYSKPAVEYSKRVLGIPAFHYDLNQHKLSSIIEKDQKFDIIMLRGCIEFCENLGDLAQDLLNVTHAHSKIILTFIDPTLGASLRTQFDDHNIKECRPPNIVKKVFSSVGFNTKVETEMFLFDRNYAFKHLKWPYSPFYIYYLILALYKLHKYGYPFDFHCLDCKCALLVLERTN